MNQTTLKKINLTALINSLSGSHYSFAIWRLPDAQNGKLIVDLEKCPHIEVDSLYEKSGFLINRFDEHHPIRPLLIQPNISIRFSNTFSIYDDSENLQQVGILQNLLNKETRKKEIDFENISEFSTFTDSVRQAKNKIQQGDFIKVVLSRYRKKKLPREFSLSHFFTKVCNRYPHSFCSLFQLPDEGIWIGASPELLIEYTSTHFKTISLAATKMAHSNESNQLITWTQKEIEEQAIVSRYIINCFKHLQLREFYEEGPKTIKIGNLAHLKTEFKVNLNEVNYEGLGYKMLDLLHPTSAVCGMPMKPALKFIHENEPFDRKYYTGFLGPVEKNKFASVYVNLRCVNIKYHHAYFFAGAGITEHSIPNKELEETKLKMNVLMDLLY